MLKGSPKIGKRLLVNRGPRWLFDLDRSGSDQGNDREPCIVRAACTRWSPEYRIVRVQTEVIFQEFLAIAPAELEIVFTELLVEETAEGVKQAAGEIGVRNLARRDRLRLLARRRNEKAAIDLGISGGNEIGRFGPRLIDKYWNELTGNEEQGEVVLAALENLFSDFRRRLRGLLRGERRDQDDGPIGRLRVSEILRFIKIANGPARKLERLVVQCAAVDADKTRLGARRRRLRLFPQHLGICARLKRKRPPPDIRLQNGNLSGLEAEREGAGRQCRLRVALKRFAKGAAGRSALTAIVEVNRLSGIVPRREPLTLLCGKLALAEVGDREMGAVLMEIHPKRTPLEHDRIGHAIQVGAGQEQMGWI